MTDIGDGRVELAVELYGGDIYTVGGNHLLGVVDGKVCSGNSKFFPDALSLDNFAFKHESVSEQVVGLIDFSCNNQFPDAGRRNLYFRQLFCGNYFNPDFLAVFAVVLDAFTPAWPSEVVIVAHEEVCNAKGAVEIMVHEVFSSQCGHTLVEIKDLNLFDMAKRLHQTCFFVCRGEQWRRILPSEHPLRVFCKCKHNGCPSLPGHFAQLLKEVLVSTVDTVKESDGCYSFHVYR